MKLIKYFIVLFIFFNVLSCVSDTTVEDAQLAKQEAIDLQATGDEGAESPDNERDG